MTKSCRTQVPFLLLLVIFIGVVLVQQSLFPPMEGGDEALHTIYTLFLQTENRLPDRTTSSMNSTRQESGQPPLTYALGSLFLQLFHTPPQNPAQVYSYLQQVRNPWLSPPNPWRVNDNLNTYIHGDGEIAFSAPELIGVNRLLRLTSLLYGVLAVIGAYNAAQEVFVQRAWVLTATVLFAFMPTFIHLASYFNNDISATAFSTLAIWQGLALLRRGASRRRLLLIGLLLSLAALSKVSALLIGAGIGLTLLLDWWRRGISVHRLIFNGFLLGLPLIILFLPWVIYGLVNYHDPLGFQTHNDPNFRHDPLLTPWQTLPYMPEIYLSYWAKFGMAKIYLSPLIYTVLGFISLTSILGYILYRPRSLNLKSLAVQRILVLIFLTIAAFGGLIRWLQELFFITGRLLYPAHLAIILLMTIGLHRFSRRFPRLSSSVRAYTVSVVVFSGIIATPISIYSAFAPPVSLSRSQLPPLQGAPVDFDSTIRFLGYKQDSPYLEGAMHSIALCWEVLRTTTHPAAFSLKLVHDGTIVADRTSLLGLGSYPSVSWQPGTIFCDDVDMLMDDPDVSDDPQPQPAQVYDVLLVLLNAQTQAVDWHATSLDGSAVQIPIIGQVVSSASDMSSAISKSATPTTIVFPDFAQLQGYALEEILQAGNDIRLSLVWNVTGSTNANWSQFIHLIGPNTASVLADGVPLAGNYPTWAWRPGEKIADNWQFKLPANLPPGDYTLELGFYRQDTGERMPVTESGNVVPNGSAVLLQFHIG